MISDALGEKFYSNGKLLITGEYVVLDGALALAIPTKFGQSLEVKKSDDQNIHWKSFDENHQIWFKETFDLNSLHGLDINNQISRTLSKILQEARALNPDFLSIGQGFEIITKLDFSRNWGLGTSSTLINNIAMWSRTDGFTLLSNSFGGSGYDIAAAQNDFPIFYKIGDKKPEIRSANINWDFKESLFFVHLNRKQDSKKGIEHYKNAAAERKVINRISEISMEVANCGSLEQFESLMGEHESIISNSIGIPPIREKLFKDYPFIIKSLGAWGGDFILATGSKTDWDYFRRKGFGTIISFSDMIKLKR